MAEIQLWQLRLECGHEITVRSDEPGVPKKPQVCQEGCGGIQMGRRQPRKRITEFMAKSGNWTPIEHAPSRQHVKGRKSR